MNRLMGGVLMFGILVVVGACAPAGKMTHDMDTMIQKASTKADHEALAAHDEQEAKALQPKAADHGKMAQAYSRGSGYIQIKSNLLQHCESLASKYREAATQYLDLAKEHRQLAAAAAK